MISEEITTDLKAGLSLDETLRKHETNLKELFAVDNPSKYIPSRKPKYYYFDKYWNNFRIVKNRVYFGTYKTEEAARLAVWLYEKYGWDKENNWRVKAEVNEILGDGY